MIEIVQVSSGSDGDATHLPPIPDSGGLAWKMVQPPVVYLEKLAERLMKEEHRAEPGVKYLLDGLPSGYTLYERARPGNATHVDRFLYGHPKKQVFRSPNEFYPHFAILMSGGDITACTCCVCAKRPPKCKSLTLMPRPQKARAKKTSTGQSAASRTHKMGSVDEEQTRDEIRILLDRLKSEAKIDEAIVEETSIDWQVEQSLLPTYLKDLTEQRAWIPRLGEIVLFVRQITGAIGFDPQSSRFMDSVPGSDHKKQPEWEAGIVAQVPEGTLSLEDIAEERNKSSPVANSGFRIEPLPDVNSQNKSFTKQYKYVPMHHIRPFIFYGEFTKDVDMADMHPTIVNAMKIMSSISVVERYHFRGIWPKASILCRGMFIGSEMICPGDAVRLMPAASIENVSDVFHVQEIRLDLSNLELSSDDDYDQGHPYQTAIRLMGKCYTLDSAKAISGAPMTKEEVERACPADMLAYGKWHHMHEDAASLDISYTQVLGRCYDAEATALWLLSDAQNMMESLSGGCSGMRRARAFSSVNDSRIIAGHKWYWGDSRAETLAIETLNGVDVSAYDASRETQILDRWRASMKTQGKVTSTNSRASNGNVALSLPQHTSTNTMVASAQMTQEEVEAAAGLDNEMYMVPDQKSSGQGGVPTQVNDHNTVEEDPDRSPPLKKIRLSPNPDKSKAL